MTAMGAIRGNQLSENVKRVEEIIMGLTPATLPSTCLQIKQITK